jgi:16S rRNA (cytosine967-C5)-methyltransferase
MAPNSKMTARALAFNVLNRVVGGDAYADIVLDKALKGMNPLDAGLATQLTYGVLRRAITLDWLIDRFSTIKAKRLEQKVLVALRLGVYQLFFLDKIPESAAINETVELVKRLGKGRSGFVNAVLRGAAREKGAVTLPQGNAIQDISIACSHPEWLVRRWVAVMGVDEAVLLMKANLKPPPKVIRANVLKNTRQGLLKELEEEGFLAEKARYSPDGVLIKGSKKGLSLCPYDPRYYIQDEASQLVSHLLLLRPGMVVLDACSAPGGKSLHMAGLMGDKGAIYAIDKYPGRLRVLKESCKRLGITMIRTICADAERPLPFERGVFDAVLVDAPCSGLGVARRVPEIKMRRGEEAVSAMSKTQSDILQNTAYYVRQGGRVVYSVCSIEKEETVDVVNGFLERNSGFELEDAKDALPPACACLVDKRGFLLTLPHKHDMDGFFGARLVRRQ